MIVRSLGDVRLKHGAEPRIQLVERRRADASGLALDATDVVVVVGTNVGKPDVEELRALDAPVAGTHGACEEGWLPRRLEVGLYGRPLAPRVLIAVGVEGNVEDLAGFVKAAVVVVIGPPVDWADVVVDDDWRAVLPHLLAAVP